jgi:hypothetical protein
MICQPLKPEQSMTRYYFRVDYGGIVYEDATGEVFSTLNQAVVHAAIVVDELTCNNKRIVVTVLDESGAVLVEVPNTAERSWRR